MSETTELDGLADFIRDQVCCPRAHGCELNGAAECPAERVRSALSSLSRKVFVPGVRRCAKCGLRLVTTNLHVADGSMSAYNGPQDCPNGCGPMWPLTEREAGNELCDRLEASEAARLRAEVERDGRTAQIREVEQIAGKALGYPWFKDDQKNFPGATEADGVCIGDHVAETIVEELAARVQAAEARAIKLRDLAEAHEGLEVDLRAHVAFRRRHDSFDAMADDMEEAADVLAALTHAQEVMG